MEILDFPNRLEIRIYYYKCSIASIGKRAKVEIEYLSTWK